MSRWMSLALCAALPVCSWPAAAAERVAEVGAPSAPAIARSELRAELSLPAQFSVPALSVSAEVPALDVPSLAAPASVLPPQLPATPLQNAAPSAAVSVAPEAAAPTPQAGWTGGARLFDGLRGAAAPAAAVLGTGAAVAVPYLVTRLGPLVNTFSYDAANLLSVAFPLPEAYAAFRRGTAKDFPWGRAALGAAGTLALGLVNAAVLGKPLWGVMHAFIALGMLAPYVIGRALDKRGPIAAYAGPTGFAPKALAARLGRDRALQGTIAAGLLMLAAAAGLYAASAAFVPALLAARLSAKAIADLLLAIQVVKGLLFIGVFAPDVANLVRGKPAHGFSQAFTLIYLASVAAFTAWGFGQAAVTPAGPIRDQYLIHGARNLCESIASALSLAALRRKAKG